MDSVLGLETRAEHAVAVAGQLPAEGLKIGRYNGVLSHGHGDASYPGEPEGDVCHQRFDAAVEENSSVPSARSISTVSTAATLPSSHTNRNTEHASA